MNLKLKKIILWAANSFPYFFIQLPYYISFQMIEQILRNKVRLVWCKNSVFHKKVFLGLSDLDLCIYDDELENIGRSMTSVNRLRRFIPLLGEVSMYGPKSLDLYLDSANIYELRRDPILLKMLKHKEVSIVASEEQKFVFASRMLLSDAHNLKKWPEFREKKWKYHLRSIDVENIEVDLNFVTTFSKRVLSPIIDYELKELLHDFIDRRTDYRLLNNYPHAILSAVCFSRWLGESVHDFSFEDGLAEIHQSTKKIQAIIFEQIKWEVWGLHSQLPCLETYEIKTHLDRVLKVLSNLSSLEAKNRTKIEHLIEQLMMDVDRQNQFS